MNFADQHSDHTDRPITAPADRTGDAPLTLLTIWAHPDDESYLGAGLMTAVARSGGRVVSVTATLGEHGTDDPQRDTPRELAARRRNELDSALNVLGAQPGVVLGFEDGACATVPDPLGARRIGHLLDEVRPDVVLGFGPDGVTGHPDHQALGRWTRAAVAARGDRTPLVTSAAGAAWPEELLPRMHEVGAFWPGYPDRRVTGPTRHVTLTGGQLDRKLAALACHGSQIGPLHDVLGADDYRRLAAAEAYCAANRAAERLLFPARERDAA